MGPDARRRCACRDLRQAHPGCTLARSYADRFGGPLPEDVNTAHRLTVVASGLDAETERIIAYLSDTFGVPINALFFRYFRVGGAEFLARTWLIDPAEAEVRSERAPASPRVQGKWNGRDYFVNVGEGSPNRAWEDARRYGFVAAGQSRWASSRLGLLQPGQRIFACISRQGYVGMGEVTGTVTPVRDFRVPGPDGTARPLLEAPLVAPDMGANADDPDLCEYVVPVRWVDARPASEAFWEPGMFANQNPACRLRDEGTLARLYEHFRMPNTG